jgi:hypothetical protein
MHRAPRPIFVVDIIDEANFAFEAESLGQAEAYAHAPWFLRSLGQFFVQHGRGCESGVTPRTRPASEAEASTYRALADEFAETSGCFFVAHLG